LVLEYGFQGDGLIYTSTNSGASWAPASQANVWSCVASSADGNKLVAAGSLNLPCCGGTGLRVTGDGLIYTSTNAGVSWTPSSAPSDNWVSLASSADGRKLVAASSSYFFETNFIAGAIYCSADSGTTWQKTSAPSMEWSSVTSSADGARLIALGGGLYASSDFGASWSSIVGPTNLPPSAGIYGWALTGFASSADGTRLVAAWVERGCVSVFSPWGGDEVFFWFRDRIYLSGDFGATWTLTGAPPNGALSALTMSADGFRVVAAGDQSVCLLPYLGPWRWTGASDSGLNNIASSVDGRRLVAANGADGLIYTSSDSGTTWTSTAAPTGDWTALSSSADGTNLLAAAYGGQLYISSSAGASWTAGGPTNYWSSVASSVDGSKLVAVSYADLSRSNLTGRIYVSADSGHNWTLSSAPADLWTSLASSADGTKLAAATAVSWASLAGSGRIHLSADSGKSWTLPEAPSNNWVSVASSADGRKLVAVASSNNGGDGLIYTSTNSGVSWTPATVPINNWVSVASSADGAKLLAIGQGAAYLSTNSGATWGSVEPLAGAGWSSVASSADGSLVIAVGGPIGIIRWPLPSPPSPVPKLSIHASSQNVVLSWLVPSTALVLQRSSDLTSPNWVDVTSPPILYFSNLHNEAALPLEPGKGFYRLRFR
jgi:hypothetical protein